MKTDNSGEVVTRFEPTPDIEDIRKFQLEFPRMIKEEIIESARSLQRKIHPDVGNPNSEYLSKLVNSAKDLILKTDFS